MKGLLIFVFLVLTPTIAVAQFDDFGDTYGEGDTVIVRADISIPGTAAYTETVRLLGLRCAECGSPEPALWLGLTVSGLPALERSGTARTDVLPTHTAAFDRNRVVNVTWLAELSEDPGRVVVWFDGVIVFDAMAETLPDIVAGISNGAVFEDGAMSYNTVDGPPAVASGPQPHASDIVVVVP